MTRDHAATTDPDGSTSTGESARSGTALSVIARSTTLPGIKAASRAGSALCATRFRSSLILGSSRSDVRVERPVAVDVGGVDAEVGVGLEVLGEPGCLL